MSVARLQQFCRRAPRYTAEATTPIGPTRIPFATRNIPRCRKQRLDLVLTLSLSKSLLPTVKNVACMLAYPATL